MEGRLANTWRLTVNEKNFIETALLSELRTDGRGLYEYRELTVKFGKEYGSSEVQLGQTHVLGFVSAQLAQPYRDRPNDGTLSIFTEFSPMADPSFEPGRPGESAVELGRIIDRGLRESRAVDTESLCVLAGKLVWSVRIDLHILDNGGNLVDAANIAALAALLTFRRPECSLGGEDGQQVIVHPPEEREPLPLMIHHLPIAFTFGFFNNGNILVMDPTYVEEAVMDGRMTITMNANGDLCAIQKAGEEGVMQSVIIQCLRLASSQVASTTKMIKEAVEAYTRERALQKIRRHALGESGPIDVVKVKKDQSFDEEQASELSRKHVEGLKLTSEESCTSQTTATERVGKKGFDNFFGGRSSWDPYSKSVDIDLLKASLASQGPAMISKHRQKQSGSRHVEKATETKPAGVALDAGRKSVLNDASQASGPEGGEKTLRDAVKPKNKRRVMSSSQTGAR